MKKLINGKEMDVTEAVLTNVGLIHSICKPFTARAKRLGYEYDDLYHVGVVGAIKAFNRFDTDSFDVKFATFAVPVINSVIQKELSNINLGAKFSADVKYLAYRFKVSKEEEFSVDSIQRTLGITRYKAHSIFEFILNSQPDSLSKVVFQDEEEGSITLEQQIGYVVDFSGIHIEEHLSVLNDKERRIVQAMLDDKRQREIGHELGVTQAHVSRMIKKIQNKIKRNMELAAV
ncbi:sigma-70 family RNA polymerase sigma factor [Priestia sp. FSL R5-0597]|uniref:sigma-70 family RNA polymerase sigma factor n=1 Tax=Priestia sp. FSL R5-0597 TaxID=2921580 RepID=UPI0030F4CF69